MRFHAGPVPSDPDFHPEAQEWRSISEPGPWAIQLIALPVAAVLLAISAALLFLVFPRDVLFAQAFAISIPLWSLVLILLLIIPVHEWIHTLVHPGWGFTEKSVIGVWLSKILFYAHYDGAMSRSRFLLVFAAPYIVLSLLPLPFIAVLGLLNGPPDLIWSLAFLSVIGGALACGDAIGFWLVLTQIPRNAVVRNKSWRTYWKPAQQKR